MGTELEYKLNGLDRDAGVDVYEIAPVMMRFGDLVRAAAAEMEMQGEIDVRVKPLREGSVVIDFVLNLGPVQSLLAFLATPDGQRIEHLLYLIFGIGVPATTAVVGGGVWVTKVIRHVKGDVTQFEALPDGNFSYEGMTVQGDIHTLIQSPNVQINLYGASVGPLDRFPGIDSVAVRMGDSSETFTEGDRDAFTRYAKAELDVESVDTVSVVNDVYLRPHRGSYDGERSRYTFLLDGNTLWPVTIKDENLLADLESGAVKFHGLDLLRVNMEWHQRKNVKTNAVTTRYVITEVVEYTPYRRPEQTTLPIEGETDND